jgi:hypothetical protein
MDSGRAEPASTVSVQWGSLTENAVAGSDGQWTARFDAVPPDGESTVQVTAEDSLGNTSAVASRETTINSVPRPDAPTINTVTGDDVVNALEAQAGIRLSGSSEANATVTLTWLGNTDEVTANPSGVWSFVMPSSSIATDGAVSITATATNAGGTSEASSREFLVDRLPPESPVVDAVSSDDQISPAEAADPILVTGTAEPGSEVTVDWGDIQLGTTASAAGDWSVFRRANQPGQNVDVEFSFSPVPEF